MEGNEKWKLSSMVADKLQIILTLWTDYREPSWDLKEGMTRIELPRAVLIAISGRERLKVYSVAYEI